MAFNRSGALRDVVITRLKLVTDRGARKTKGLYDYYMYYQCIVVYTGRRILEVDEGTPYAWTDHKLCLTYCLEKATTECSTAGVLFKVPTPRRSGMVVDMSLDRVA